MQHHIIAKFTPAVTDKAAAIDEIRSLYASAADIPGITAVDVIPNCTDRPNRFDVMIRLTMVPDALLVWDASDLHHEWKSRWGALLESKTIFDCE